LYFSYLNIISTNITYFNQSKLGGFLTGSAATFYAAFAVDLTIFLTTTVLSAYKKEL